MYLTSGDFDTRRSPMDHEILQGFREQINSNMNYAKRMELLDSNPLLYALLEKDKWDITLANHVIRNHQDKFHLIPRELITHHMYVTYLHLGVRNLNINFNPVVIDELVDIKIAIFLLRSCRCYTRCFISNRKYRYHLMKMHERGYYMSNSLVYTSGLIYKIIGNPTKYVKDDRTRIEVVEWLFKFNSDYKRFTYEQILDFVQNDFEENLHSIISMNTYSCGEFLYRLYNEGSDEVRHQIVDALCNWSYIKKAIDLEVHGWQLDHHEFIKFLRNHEYRFTLEMSNGEQLKFTENFWFVKKLIKALKSIKLAQGNEYVN